MRRRISNSLQGAKSRFFAALRMTMLKVGFALLQQSHKVAVKIRNILAKIDLQQEGFLYLVIFGSIIFYLPFLCRQFLGDDWLWLSNAKKALDNPIIFVERPMYGYFRPLYMVIVFLWSHTFGIHAPAFSMVNILLHAGNVYLLAKVLDRLGMEKLTRNLAVLIFAFYFLNSPAIEWISVGHDLWVTCLCLLFLLRLLKFIERPRATLFLQIFLIGFAAMLIKESGFVTLGIFLLTMLLKRRSPFAREYRIYTLSLVVSYLAFLIVYLKTGRAVGSGVSIGLQTLVSLWYFLGHLVFPVSKRIVEAVPSAWTWTLLPLRIAVTLMLPLTAIYLWKKGGLAGRLFVLWPPMFVATIAIMITNVGLFDLYPERGVTRYLYTPAIGYAVCLALILRSLIGRFAESRVWRPLSLLLVALFISANFIIVRFTSQVYFENQQMTQEIIRELGDMQNQWAESDSLMIITDDFAGTPQTISYYWILQAVLFVEFDKEMAVQVVEEKTPFRSNLNRTGGRLLTLRWNTSTGRFDPI